MPDRQTPARNSVLIPKEYRRAEQNLLTAPLSIRYTNCSTPATQSGWRTPRASRTSSSKRSLQPMRGAVPQNQWKSSKYPKISLDTASDK
jgi:hypothetical protein